VRLRIIFNAKLFPGYKINIKKSAHYATTYATCTVSMLSDINYLVVIMFKEKKYMTLFAIFSSTDSIPVCSSFA
jgi:hypothetical protein